MSPDNPDAGMPDRQHEDFENIVDELPLGILSCDLEGNITAVNDFLLEILGSPSAEATKNINMLTFKPLVEAGISSVIKETLRTGHNSSIETPYRSKWDKELFLSFRTFPRKKENGDTYGCHAIIEDLTFKKRTTLKLEENRQKDELISTISSRFINSSFREIDEDINRTLRDLGTLIGAERVSVFSVAENTEYIIKTHEWHAEGIGSKISFKEKWDTSELTFEKLGQMEIFNIPDVEKIEKEKIKEVFNDLGIASIAMVPFSSNGAFKGFIEVDSQNERRTWSNKEIYVLKIVGEMISNILERKNTETMLIQKEKEFEKVINSIDSIIWKATFDSEGELLNYYVSEPVDRILGFPEGTIGNDWDRFFGHVHPDDLNNVTDAFKRSFEETGTSIDVDYRIVGDDGSVVWISSTGSSTIQDDGTYHTYGTSLNITERKEAEQAIARSERKYRSLIEQSDDAVILNDLEGQIIEVNNGACEMLGYSSEELQKMNIDDLLAPEFTGRGKIVLEKVRKDGVFRGESKYRTSKGDIIYIEGNAKLIEGYDNLVQAIIRDVTHRKKAEKEIIRSEKKYRSLFEQSNDVIVLHDKKGKILDANKKACEMMGECEEELKGKKISERILPEDRHTLAPKMQEVMETGSCRNEVRLMHTSGRNTYIDVSSSMINEEEGIIQAVGRDVTERMHAEAAMLRAKIEAETASRTKSEFLANMSHELRTPLNSIIGFSDVLLAGIAGELLPKQEHYIKHVSKSGHHLLDLINDILDLSKVEAGKMKLDLQTMDHAPIVREIISMMESLAYEKNINISAELSDNNTKVIADRSKFKQILYNLVGNAIKFTDDDGTIRIVSRVKDDKLLVSVIDTGIGISWKDQKRLFKPFSQIESSNSRSYEGTGLGLALVRELLEMHGGNIWVESEPGKGSKFIFELPLAESL